MLSDKMLIKKAYVECSTYRCNVIKAIGNKVKIPSVIAKDAGILPNHVSKILSELREKKLVICINEEARKGRLYKLTKEGIIILNEL